MVKVPILNKKREKDNTKNGKDSRVLEQEDFDDVSDLKIIDKLVFKLLISRRVSQKYGVLQLS